MTPKERYDKCPITKEIFVIMTDNLCSSCGLAHGISALSSLKVKKKDFKQYN